MDELILVAGGGGFIGGHLVRALLDRGHRVRAADSKPVASWQQVHPDAESVQLDLREVQACRAGVEGVAQVYNLAADMGGMGFIENNRALCMLSVLINTHLLMASRETHVERYFFASSACVYSALKQDRPYLAALCEGDAYPAMPEDGYGWEKLFSERMCRHFREDFGLATRIARYHNVYGPYGAFEGGREKAPAALCRKVAEAKLSGVHEIEIWGDGEQTRSFTHISDCVAGTIRIMESEIVDPLNVGSSQLVTINQLVDVLEGIAGIRLSRRYNRAAPQGVRGRNSDNTMVRSLLGWEPSTALESGLADLYQHIHDDLAGRKQPASLERL